MENIQYMVCLCQSIEPFSLRCLGNYDSSASNSGHWLIEQFFLVVKVLMLRIKALEARAGAKKMLRVHIQRKVK